MRKPIDVLGAMEPAELAALLQARPALVFPRPASLAELSNRAFHYPAVHDALRPLDGLHLAVLDALVILGPAATPDAVAELIGVEPAGLPLARLASLLLLDVDGDRVDLFPGVRQALPSPGGLGPPIRAGLQRFPPTALHAIAANLGLTSDRRGGKDGMIEEIATSLETPAGVAAALATLPDTVREWLADLAVKPEHRFGIRGGEEWFGGPTRTVLEYAFSRALIVPLDWSTVAIPREVGVRFRGNRPLGLIGVAPAVTPHPVEAGAAAAVSARHAVALVATLLEEIDARPLAALKSGGVGIRELRRVAKRLDVEEGVATLVTELAFGASLIGYTFEVDVVVPTAAADLWLGEAPAERWLVLAREWLATHRHPSIAGTEGTDGKVIPAVMGHGGPSGAELRHEALGILAALPDGQGAAANAVAELVWWRGPRRWSGSPGALLDLVRYALAEAEFLGVAAGGAVTPGGRALLVGDDAAARAWAVDVLPPPLTSFTVQADLTAVVPGALEPLSHTVLADMADVESGGTATVWRFTEASVRRAFDNGRTAEELNQFLDAHATHGVPQTLTYLIADIARRHGHLRVATGMTVIHGEDDALVAEVVHHRRTARLGLRLVAPTVAISTKPADTVVDGLRAAGYLPMREKPDGTISIERPERRRADVAITDRAVGVRRAQPPLAIEDLEALATRLLQTSELPPPAVRNPLTDDEDFLDLLYDACDEGTPVVFHYRGVSGLLIEVVAVPNQVSDFALEATTDRGPQSFLLERIEWVGAFVATDD